jgi:ELWxxDGT repeat protein
VNGTLYLAAHNGVDANGFELWKSNGTAAGTVRVKSISSPTGLQHLVNFNNTLYFTADKALWKSNGTDAGTTLVKTLNTVGYTRPYSLLAASGKLWIVEDQGAGWTLWKSDGTTAGTLSLKSFPNNSGAFDARVFNLNGTLYFNGSTGPGGIELWKSDGTVAGTVLVSDLDPGIGSSQPNSFAEVNGTLYFSANDYTAGERRLWKSNGTAAGTVPAANYPAAVANLIPVNGTLFFTGNDGKTGNELWKTHADGPGRGRHAPGECGRHRLCNPGRPELRGRRLLLGRVGFFGQHGGHCRYG